MSDATLTLSARGPAVAEELLELDSGAVTDRREVELDAELEIDAEWLRRKGSIYKQGALIRRSDVAELVVDQLSTEERTYRAGADRHDDWQLRLDGRLDDWLNVALVAADDKRTVGSNDTIAETACHILDDLEEHGGDRPLLAMADLLGQYDVDAYDRAEVLARVGGDEVPTGEEATADA